MKQPAFQSLPRIRMPSPEAFYRDYVMPQRPVVITDLFEGEPIRRLASLDALQRELRDMRILLYESFEDTFGRIATGLIMGKPVDSRRGQPITVADYLALLQREPETRAVCAEFPVPVQETQPSLPDSRPAGGFAGMYRTPACCFGPDGQSRDCKGEVWLANRGSYTHLHFDRDHRHILQYQMFGSKRFLLVDPAESRKLLPVMSNTFLSPEALSEREFDEFARFVGGWQTIVGGGEAVFIPGLMWHYAEYVETSMALTMRFFRNRYNRFLAENIYPDFRVQLLGYRLIDPARADPKALQAFEQIEALIVDQSRGDIDKARELDQLLDRVYSRLQSDERKPATYARSWTGVLVDGLKQQRQAMKPMVG